MSVEGALCQPGGGASCGACCGLYNFAQHDRAAVTETLARARRVLTATEKTPEAFRESAQRLRAQGATPLFPMVRVCPLLGFLDDGHQRVGCLAHPLVTGGRDLRDCGAYTADICETFLCPSHSWLTEAQALLVRRACPDWYLYGLVITDVEWVKTTLGLVEAERAAPLDPGAILRHPRALRACHDLFALKETAPDRPRDGQVFGAFGPDPAGGEEPVMRVLDYAGLDVGAAPEDHAVLCLGYAPETREALQAARRLIREKVQALVAALGE
ncbi:MAG TPA: hypothetical protein VK013_11880 [Myxococcaceae bacterium]|nr:hypothetical protein [Myxococcaceae bacterium]